jgi:hypothetical protein
MLITNLKAGLGNQMFQYATGKFLTEKNNTDLYFDTNWYSKKEILNSDTPRKMKLNDFQVDVKILDRKEARRIKYPFGKISEIWQDIEKKIFKKYYQDYHPELLQKISDKLSKNPGANIYLNGFFQSEKNFLEIRSTLLKEFQLKTEFITEKVKNFADDIEKENSVSIHIRRGDYAKNPKAKAYHGLCPISYYRDAIDLIAETIKHPHFFIFTDDVDWVKENLKINFGNTFISGSGLTGPQELWLMSKCKHNIIANSSFSWWGAWLNQNPVKNVIAPKKWTVKNTDHPNIIPDGWITI